MTKTFPLITLSESDAATVRESLQQSCHGDPGAYTEWADSAGVTATTLLRAAAGLPVPRSAARLICLHAGLWL